MADETSRASSGDASDRLLFWVGMSQGMQIGSPQENIRWENQETPHMQLPNSPPIYLDYHATTPVDPRVAAVVLHAMTTAFGNANSSEHVYGEVAAALVTDARREAAALVPADYPLHEKFARLTRQEERWGLYEHPTAIGTRQA